MYVCMSDVGVVGVLRSGGGGGDGGGRRGGGVIVSRIMKQLVL